MVTYLFGTAPVPPGKIFREHHLRQELVAVQSGAVINKGDAVIVTPTGLAQLTQSVMDSTPGKRGVAINATPTGSGYVADPTCPTGYLKVVFGGFIGVNKCPDSAFTYGQPVGAGTTTAGYNWSAGQVMLTAEANLYKYTLGYTMEAAASGDASVGIQLIE